MIYCANPKAQYLAHQQEIDAAISRVLADGRYILGDQVAKFEEEFASYLGVGHAVGVGSGTEALHLALTACGVLPGDEVITVSHTAVATIVAIAMCGATPVFVDIEPKFFTLDPTKLERAINRKTKVIIPVHIYGQPAELDSITSIANRHGIIVLEDCAQAHGAIYKDRFVGTWGDLACFSFYPTKNLGALGDGGIVVTSDGELARKLRLLREYGWSERYVSEVKGWNSRLDEIQAAVLRVKLKYLNADNDRRIFLAETYSNELVSCPNFGLPEKRFGAKHVYHLYVIRSKSRNELKSHLGVKGINTLIHYPVPVHRQSAFLEYSPDTSELTQTEQASEEVLSLPIYPELTSEEQLSVIQALHSFEG
jgi:dTDP-3-amino-3,4,6-trideoxy-alpha-D-glucose transaminase